MPFKQYVNRQRRRFGKFTKQRYGTWKNPKLMNVVKDIKMLKDVINAEKKRLTITPPSPVEGQTFVPQRVAQVDYLLSGHYFYDLTPKPEQGITYDTRNGSSIKLHSSYIKIQFSQMVLGGFQCPMKLKVFLIQVLGTPQDDLVAFTRKILQPNPFVRDAGGSTTDVRDYQSSWNPDTFGLFKVLSSRTCWIPPDIGATSQNNIRNCELKMKYNKGKGHHVRFDKNTQEITHGQLFLLIVADSGNLNTSGTPCPYPSGVPEPNSNTGANLDFVVQHYYYDN